MSSFGERRAAGLKLAPRKCRFGVRRVEYLGAVVSDGMLSMSEQRVKDLRTVPTPTTVRELRRMLGGFSYVQRWLPGLADTAKPLYDSLNKNPYQRLNVPRIPDAQVASGKSNLVKSTRL
ncbi:hypothetical protein Pcinc_028706 [Petrolisthes cinctipes]|uniref:Reverse transcriptase n=1 Tax=Petrolisthes cinctipes TaxID=88211 RepID=A0AAE1F2B3_PETCI|nr:hypothetical protein Pcinc_028706 [Petrolisthes cinctipes]